MVRGVSRPGIINRSGYSSRDLERLLGRGVQVLGIRKRLVIEVVPGPGRTRGCASVGGDKIVIQIAPPAKLSRRKLARIFEHELAHIAGQDHDDMNDRVLWSKGGEPEWSRGLPLRRVKRRGDNVEDELR